MFGKIQLLKSQLVALARFDDRSQQFILLSNPNQHAVRFAQFCKVSEQTSYAFVPRLALEHVLADEIVESLNIFHSHRLVEDVHGLG